MMKTPPPAIDSVFVLVSAALALQALLSACGSLGGGGGGAENLPDRGVQPYLIVRQEPEPVETPDAGTTDAGTADAEVELPDPLYILQTDNDVAFGDPFVQQTSTGILELWATRTTDDLTDIVRISSADEGLTWSTPEPVPGVLAWGDDTVAGVSQPFLLTSAGTTLLAVVANEQESVRVGVWNETNITGASTPISILTDTRFAAIDSPSLLRTDGQWVLYASAVPVDPADPEETLAPVLVRTTSADGATWQPAAIVWSTELACADVAEDCVAAGGIGSPEVRLASSGAGRPVYRLFFSSGEDARASIHFAASHDGLNFSLFDRNPIIEEDRYDEFGASNVFDGERYLLFFSRNRRGTERGIVWAIHAPENPVERF
jgi:hypothetical protein